MVKQSRARTLATCWRRNSRQLGPVALRPGRQAGRQAVVEAVTGTGKTILGINAAEESVLNSLLMSPTTVGRDGNTSEGLDPDTVVRLLREHGRLA